MLNPLLLAALVFFSVEWQTNLEKAMEDAQEMNKLVLLNFSGSDWCAPCILLKKELFESEHFKTVASTHLVLVQADFPRQKKNKLSAEQTAYNESLAEKYNPTGKFPLTLLLAPTGEVLHTWDGYPKDFTVDKMRIIIQNAK